MKLWQLQDAKSRFSEVVKNAQAGEAQVVTRNGEEVAVVVGYDDYLDLIAGKRSILETLGSGPDLSALELERDRTPVRAIELE